MKRIDLQSPVLDMDGRPIMEADSQMEVRRSYMGLLGNQSGLTPAEAVDSMAIAMKFRAAGSVLELEDADVAFVRKAVERASANIPAWQLADMWRRLDGMSVEEESAVAAVAEPKARNGRLAAASKD